MAGHKVDDLGRNLFGCTHEVTFIFTILIVSAMVLGGLPPAFLLYLMVANHDYVSVLFTRPLGILMLVGAAVILSVGIFWMSRIVKVEV